MTTHNFPLLRLNRNADKRLRQGHCWIYSNEVDIKVTPLRQFEAGQQVVGPGGQRLQGRSVRSCGLPLAVRLSARPAFKAVFASD